LLTSIQRFVTELSQDLSTIRDAGFVHGFTKSHGVSSGLH